MFFLNLCKQTCCHYRIRQTEKTELSIMKYIVPPLVSLWLCPDCRMPYLSIVRSERDLSAAILVAKFTGIERLEEVRSICSKYLSTLLPIILSGDRLQFAMPGPGKNESQQSQTLQEHKRINDDTRI